MAESSSMSMDGNVISPSWDIFSPEAMDLSTVEREYVEYREQNVTNTKTLTKYEIETRDKDAFIEPHMGFLEVKYRLTIDQPGVTQIPLSDKIALQNHGLSLFKNAEYLIEDQRIEYLDDPAMAWTIKNVSDFSKQYGDSIASAEGFYLDTNDHSTLKNCNLRFFVLGSAGAPPTANARTGVELFFKQVAVNNGAATNGQLIAYGWTPTVAASATTWQVGDVIVALLDNSYPTPGSNAGGLNNGAVLPDGYPGQVSFAVATPAATGLTNYLQILTQNQGVGTSLGNVNILCLTDGNGTYAGANGGIVTPYVRSTGEKVNMFVLPAAGALPAASDQFIIPTLITNAVAGGGALVLSQQPTVAGPPATLYGAVNDNIIGGTINPENYNQGFQKRYLQAIRSAMTTNSPTGQYHSLWIPLKNIFMFCRAYDKISRGLRHRMVFNRNPDNLALLRHGSTPNRYFQLEYVSCWIPRLKPSLSVLKEIEAKLVSGGSYTVNFTDLTCWHTNLVMASSGTQTAYQLATTTKKPIRVWIAFQLQNRYEGDQLSNKRVFDHMNTAAIQVRLNQQLFPLYEYKFDNDQQAGYLPTGNVTGVQEILNYQRVYNALLSAAYKNKDASDGSLITYEQWRNIYPIYYFDLTAQPEDLYKANKYAEIEVRWTNQSSQNYYAWVIYESERALDFVGVNGSMALKM